MLRRESAVSYPGQTRTRKDCVELVAPQGQNYPHL